MTSKTHTKTTMAKVMRKLGQGLAMPLLAAALSFGTQIASTNSAQASNVYIQQDGRTVGPNHVRPKHVRPTKKFHKVRTCVINGLRYNASSRYCQNRGHATSSFKGKVGVQIHINKGYKTKTYRKKYYNHKPVRFVPVFKTCNPNTAKRIARKRYGLRHAHVRYVGSNKIVIAGKRRGHHVHMAFGHKCRPLGR